MPLAIPGGASVLGPDPEWERSYYGTVLSPEQRGWVFRHSLAASVPVTATSRLTAWSGDGFAGLGYVSSTETVRWLDEREADYTQAVRAYEQSEGYRETMAEIAALETEAGELLVEER